MDIEKELEEIKKRNARVETDKAWEISWFRRLLITIITYLVAGVWLVTIKDANPWLKALVPSVGYLLSTFAFPIIKTKWINKYRLIK